MKWLVCLMVLVVLTGCTVGKLHTTIRPNTSFDQKSGITVEPLAYDPLHVGATLSQCLAVAGFNVMSAAVVAHKEEYEDKIDSSESGSEMYASKERVAEYKSRYIVQFNYTTGYSWASWRLDSFWANVVDLKTGQIVATATYKEADLRRSPEDLCGEFAQKLVEEISTR